MANLIALAVKFRVLVVALAALVAYHAYDRLRIMPADALPELNPPIVEVQTEAPGLSANEVEIMVSFGVEELLSGLPWVKSLKSDSITGLSTVRLEFEPGTNLMRARQLVQERLTTSFLLPNVAKPPVMQQPISSTNRILMIALSSKELDPIKLSTLTLWTVKPRLLGLPGVANVSVWGERRRQIQVQMDPKLMQQHKIRQSQVIASAGDALWVSPLSFLKSSVPGTGGWIETANQRLEIRHVLPMSSAGDIAKIGIDGTKLKLGDVAQVVEGHPPMVGDAVVPDGNGLLLVIEKFPGANILEVTKSVEDAMRGLKQGLQGVDMDVQAFRPATFVEWALANTASLTAVGLLLAMLGLGILQMQWRSPVIGLISISLSLLAALVVLSYQGAGLNVIVIAGLAAALPSLIDDAAIVGASLSSGAQQPRTAAGGSPLTAIAAAAEASRGPLVYATLIGLLAIAPVYFISGMGGALLQPMATAFAIAVLASFAIALTVVPALIALLGVPRANETSRITAPVDHVGRGSAAKAMLAASTGPGIAVTIAVLLCAIALPASLQLRHASISDGSLLPQFNERDLVVQFDAPGGTSHPEMMRLTSKLVGELRTITGVRSAFAHIGRAIGGDQSATINASRIWISVNSSADYARVLAGVQKTLEAYPDMTRRIRTYLGDRLGIDTVGGRAVTARIYGHQVDELRSLARQVKDKLERIDGLGSVRVNDLVEEEQLHVTVDLDAAAAHGLKPGDVRRFAATLFSGLEVGRIFEAQKVYEVVVWSTPETRNSIESLSQALIELPAGGHIRLGDVAKVALKSMPSQIRREGVSLYLDVIAEVGNRGISSAYTAVDAAAREIKYPLGYYPVVLGDASRQGSSLRAGIALIVAALGILLLLQAAFRSWPLALATFLVLPLSMAGGLAAVSLAGLPISLGVLIGLAGIYALAARHTVLLIGRTLAAAGPGSLRADAMHLQDAARDRVPAILATVACSALVVVPAAYLGGSAGSELLYPMAVVVLGGLVSTLLLITIILPALYLWVGHEREADMSLDYAT